MAGASAPPPQPPAYEPVPTPAYVPVPAASGYVPPSSGNMPPAAGYAPPQPGSAAAAGGLSDNSAAAISYLTFIPAVIFLLIEPYNKKPFIRFHAIQCIALSVVSFALHIGIMIISMILHFIPLSFVLFSLCHLAVTVILFIFWLMAIIKASKGEWYKIPFIGDFAEKQARS
jgi:uncharacterized membrane protein